MKKPASTNTDQARHNLCKLFGVSLAITIGIFAAGYMLMALADYLEVGCRMSSRPWCKLGVAVTVLFGTWVIGGVALIVGMSIYIAKRLSVFGINREHELKSCVIGWRG